MANSYMDSIAITDENEARVLGSPSAWEILQKLRHAGMRGMTAEEISNDLQIPISTVYNTLTNLRAANLIETRRMPKRVGKPSKELQDEEKRTGKKKRIYVEKIEWGSAYLDENFQEYLDRNISKMLDDTLFTSEFANTIDKIIQKIKNGGHGAKILPSEEICPNCKESHEAEEFIWALLHFIMVQTYYSKDLQEVCKKYRYVFDPISS